MTNIVRTVHMIDDLRDSALTILQTEHLFSHGRKILKITWPSLLPNCLTPEICYIVFGKIIYKIIDWVVLPLEKFSFERRMRTLGYPSLVFSIHIQ